MTTTRVLCSPCTVARAAEKQRAKALAGVPAAAVPVPAASLQKRAAPPPTPAPAKPAPPPPAKPAPKPVKRAAAKDEDDEEDSEESRRPRVAPKERESKTAMLAWIAAAVMAVGAGAVVFVIYKNKQAQNVQIAAILSQQKTVYDKIVALAALDTETAATELLTYSEQNKVTWQASDNAAEITNLIAKAKGRIERENQRKATLAAMDKVESGVEGIAQLTPSQIAELRRLLGEIEPKAELVGADFLARVGVARKTLDQTYVRALHEDAKAFAAANPDKDRLALQRFTVAEDEVQKLLDDSIRVKNRENEKFFTPHYQEIIEESDKLVEEAFPLDSLDKLPWVDLLRGDQVTHWVPAEVKGFSHRIDDGVMTMIGPDADAGYQGLISIGDREQWRDFEVEMTFTLDSGDFDLYFRLGKKPDNSVTKVNISAGEEGLVAGKEYTITARLIGSNLTMTYYPEDLQQDPARINWTKTRKGGLAFGLQAGTRMKITKMRVHELRASNKQ
ncbi:MAG TPA: hypothetical protein VK843_06225 [Planctomycetota bacterium]|nr:hypothetical protein [Planctomycetota bacterium]